MNRLEGKVAIITGGNSGVGAATAQKFAAEGAKVVITARREAQLEEVAAKIREAGGEVLPIVSDISKVEDAERVVALTLEKFGKVDVLINNAGVLDNGLKAIDSFTDDDMNRVIDINTKGTMCMTREVAKEMAKTGYGSIVNVASVAGVMGCGGAAYVASKAAIIGLTRHTALRFTGTNVRCNAICPGTIVTPMVAGRCTVNSGSLSSHRRTRISTGEGRIYAASMPMAAPCQIIRRTNTRIREEMFFILSRSFSVCR